MANKIKKMCENCKYYGINEDLYDYCANRLSTESGSCKHRSDSCEGWSNDWWEQYPEALQD